MIASLTFLLCIFGAFAQTQQPSPLTWNLWIGKNFTGDAYTIYPESREFALYSVAVHDALNSVRGFRKYAPYVGYLDTDLETTQVDDIIVAAAYKWLLLQNVATRVNTAGTGLYFNSTNQALYTTRINDFYNSFVNDVVASQNITSRSLFNKAVELGTASAQAVWNARALDGFNRTIPDPYFPSDQPGVFYLRPNEASTYPLTGYIRPFVVPSSQYLVVPPPPLSLDDPAYLADLAYTKEKGALFNSTRTVNESNSAIFAVVLAGNRFQAQLLLKLLPQLQNRISGFDLRWYTRLQALVSVSFADNTMHTQRFKNMYKFWRPWQAITRGIEYADKFPGLAKLYDPNWKPFQVTPNNPEYPGGHSSASALFSQVIRKVTGWEKFPDGPITVTAPNGISETYNSVNEIEERMYGARIFGGMHLRGSNIAGQTLGRQTANYVVDNSLLPIQNGNDDQYDD